MGGGSQIVDIHKKENVLAILNYFSLLTGLY
jgi:hypothetical protein